MTHASIPADERAALGLSDTLVRLSPGIEHSDDLIHDLIAGLDEGWDAVETEEARIDREPATA